MTVVKFKINLNEGVIELEGDKEFVEGQIANIENVAKTFSNLNTKRADQAPFGTEGNNSTRVQGEGKSGAGGNPTLDVPETFGEWMLKFNDNINDLEKALVTSFYVQNQSSEKEFKTSEVNKCLKDHGIKLSNPSSSLKVLAVKKYTFQTKKVGSLRFMRVSKDGEAHLTSILRGSISEE